jgi:sugar lactone lactonase YvrE
MADREFATLLEGGSFFEGPRWHDGRWWVSDFYTQRVQTIDADGHAETVLTVDQQPSGLGWLPDGSLLVVSMRDRRILRRSPDGEVTEHADVSEHCGGHLNDMVVDASGRAYVGDFGFDLMGGGSPASASVKRVDPDGTVTVVAEDLRFPNGSVITPDGGTLIVGETWGNRYTAFDIGADGSLTNRRVWAELGPEPVGDTVQQLLGQIVVAPDGCSLDAEGHIWCADGFGNRAVRIAPGGAIVDEIAGPGGMGVYACALGGDDGRTLLLCCAPDFYEHTRAPVREAVLVTTDVAVPHAGLP